MSNYFVSEIYPNSHFTAGALREDIETVLLQNRFQKIRLSTGPGFLSKLKVYTNFYSIIKKMDPPGLVFFHFPLRSRVIRTFFRLIKKKGFKTIAYVHDFEGLRDSNKTILQKETKQLSHFDIAIAQNEAMRELISQDSGVRHIATLEMYDYLGTAFKPRERKLSTHVSFAGNLSKAPFIYQLHILTSLQFSVYGVGAEKIEGSNVSYKGAIDPRVLPGEIEGSFGLVWDGDSIEKCRGTGNYLRYNIPHKLALYIISGLPPIVWTESATARWVKEKGIGIAVNSLQEIRSVIDNLTETAYQQFQKNMIELREKMVSGIFLQNAINKCLDSSWR